ncbi:hypothetical protein AB834_06070 [PVC group bacterium (ex Bugula neritina AB1)]|nr:hypothetical protein AB834_06070 [PVC group bacterium (ex Bugula neritina AB1)]
MKDLVISYLEKSAALKKDVAENQAEVVSSMIDVITSCYRKKGKVLVMGNGGSASDAQHFAAELVGRFCLEREALPAIALTANTSTMTAIANDYGYEDVFVRQVQAYLEDKDVVLGISTSGSSKNVIKALTFAKDRGVPVLGLTGLPGDPLCSLSDHALRVPSVHTSLVQEVHIAVLHIICKVVEENLFR